LKGFFIKQFNATVTGYRFSELDAKVQSKLITRYSQQEYEYMDSSLITDLLETDLENFHNINESTGFEGFELNWSLNNCQGDGVSFYKGNIRLATWLETQGRKIKARYGLILRLKKQFNHEIILNVYKFDRHYSHENTFRIVSENVDFNLDYYDNLENPNKHIDNLESMVNELCEFFTDHLRGICKELESTGYSEIDYQTSEERAREMLGEDDTYYLSNGKAISEDFYELTSYS